MHREPIARLLKRAAGGLLVVVMGLSSFALRVGELAAQEAVASAAPEEIQFFETHVRPLLAKHCWDCHGPQKQNGELRLDSLQSIIDGGESGPALVPRNPAESLLLQAVRYESLEMPPGGKLEQKEIDVLHKWIQAGAHWPNQKAIAAAKRKSHEITAADRNWWSFQPLKRPTVPKIDKNESQNAIDAFVLDKLRQESLAPAPPASKRELIRRVYFDLIGLPPSYKQVQQFVSSKDPKAFDEIVKQLLARPEYGERWGRHWLDVVRFAQTNGYERDDEKPLAWRYRDYVINSFNEDKPYDQFVREQIAGDELTPLTDDALDATGFFRLGVWDDEPDDARQAEFDGLDDIVSTTGTAFLGLTIGCARCHSHKFDPIPQQDYYRMLAFLRGIRPYQKPNEKDTSIFRELPGGGRTLAVSELSSVPETRILVRGDSGNPTKPVTPGFPQVFFTSAEAASAEFAPQGGNESSSGRRTVLADWIASPQNPLTARVIVNRVWQHHFGRGIVETPSDFGKTGSLPSHPELLDYLAAEFIASGWHIKKLHTLILSSRTWQQSSRVNHSLAQQVDPDNRLLWRQNARRLEAECVRDSLLAVTGTLNSERGGRGFFPIMPQEVLAGQSRPGIGWDDSSLKQRRRRSVYIFAKRGVTDPLLEVFDVASTEQPIAARTSTIVAPQALTLLNSRFVADQANDFADRIALEVNEADDSAVVTRAWELALGRRPTSQELHVATGYLRSQRENFANEPSTIQFRQSVPTSLNTPMWQRRSGAEMLQGPSTGWSYTKGHWIDIGDAIHMVQMHQTPAAVYTGLKFESGKVTGRFRVDGQPDALSISVGASVQNQLLHGVQFLLDTVASKVVLQLAGPGRRQIAETPFIVPRNQWTDFEINVNDHEVSLHLNGKLMLKERLETRPSGHLAFRSWGASLEVADVVIKTQDAEHRVGIDAPMQIPDELTGWTAYGGRWSTTANDVAVGETSPYQYAVWDSPRFGDGEIRCELRTNDSSDAELLFRVTDPRVGVDTFNGYEVAINPARNYLRLGRHEHNFTLLRDVPYDFEANQWYQLRVHCHGNRIQVFLGDEGEPRIDITDDTPLPEGQIGLRCARAANWRNLQVMANGKRIEAEFEAEVSKIELPPHSPTRRAISSMCNLVFNLNEFVFID